MSGNPRQQGSTLVEFALGLVVFLTFALGVVEFSRLLWTWGAANEATRWGARMAVVCGQGDAQVLERMRRFLPQLQAHELVVDWYDTTGLNDACTSASCTAVHVRIVGMRHAWISPVGWTASQLLAMPEFSTYLPRESMGQDPDSAAVCSGV